MENILAKSVISGSTSRDYNRSLNDRISKLTDGKVKVDFECTDSRMYMYVQVLISKTVDKTLNKIALHEFMGTTGQNVDYSEEYFEEIYSEIYPYARRVTKNNFLNYNPPVKSA